MARQDRMSLQTVAFNPTPFQAVTFTPQAADVSILQRSLAQQEEREQKATQSLAEANKVFATMRSQLHQDPRTMGRFEEWQRGKMDRLYQLRNLDPDRAFKEATLLGTEVANDAEMQGRIRNNTEFAEWEKNLKDNKNINQVTKDRLLEQESSRFDSELEYDALGNVTGTKKWKALEEPVNTVSRLDLAAFTAKIVAPTDTTTGSESKTGHTNADSSGYVRGSSSQTNRKVLSKERLHEVFDKVFAEFPGARASLMQDYKDDIYRLGKIEEELKTANEESAIQLNDEKRMIRERLYKDGGAGVQRTPEEYMAWGMDVVLDNEAYNHSSHITGSTNITNDAPVTQTGSGLFDGLSGLPDGFYGNDFFGLNTVGTVMNNMTGVGYTAGQAVGGASDAIRNILSNMQRGQEVTVDGRTYTKTAQGVQITTAKKK